MKPSASTRRLSAIALAVAALLLLYGLTLHLGFVLPLARQGEEQALLQLSYQRFARLEAQREQVKAHLDKAGETTMAEGSLLSGPEPEAAQAQLMQVVVDRLAQQADSGLPCSVLNRVPGPVAKEGRLARITLAVELECGPQALASTLHRLESEAPVLRVDAMAIRRMTEDRGDGAVFQRLSVNLQVVGYLIPGEGAGHD
ncbi:MAG: type II secretion system protein M [Paucimonas sp.]|jgi:hypothetical protein|nr:type II secretion system protein M [Paucimonas sp.]